MSTGRTPFACGEVGELDLNKAAVPDESYVHSVDHWNWISNPSNCTTPSDVSLNEGKATFFNFVDWRESNNDFSSEASALDQQEDITNSTLTTSRSKDTTGEKTHQKITMSELNVKKSKEDIREAKRIKESCTIEREVPQSSSESYEAIVLKQAESSVDEYCVSSTPLEEVSGLDEKKYGLDEKKYGLKLKRGRRMKDFRKEILPGLASLSREEICEDIKIMELAIRSRQYKKYRAKTATRNDCVSSSRSRRSRLGYVG
ncbi:hypothetical protein BUALT_BualtUnG0003300 [Buddleja alternifolia]|uniref:Uncharacterized protein n=1 Tax=Buddleja alternifolia TaxID=168488 RepID=A0AAV6W7T3_9LAMI|nr:hypothetical protein BUALT_BualtUnG0003300 [Buddleja alternifolia]